MILVHTNQIGNQDVFQICDLGVVPVGHELLSVGTGTFSGLAPASAHQRDNGNAGSGVAMGLVNAGIEPLAARHAGGPICAAANERCASREGLGGAGWRGVAALR